MRTISTDFRNAMNAPVKEIDGKLVITDGVDEITSADDLVKFSVEGEAVSVGKSVLRKLSATYIGTRNLVGRNITVKFGVRIAGGTFEYIDLGQFLVTQCDTSKEKDMTTLTGYDQMIYSIISYQPASFTYPTTVSGLYQQIASVINLPVETTTIPLGDLTIDEDLYANISGTQYRTILEDIAILGGQVVIINEDGELALRSVKSPTNTPDELTYDHLKKLSIKEKYGRLNSLVLSRQPTEDNVTLQNVKPSIDATSVDTTNNLFITGGHTLVDGDNVRVSSDDTLPSPLDIDTIYFVNNNGGTTDLAFYTTKADAIADTNRIDITDAGTGTHTVTPVSDIENDGGLTEIKIINNEIIDKRREDVATEIFPYFEGTEYYPFEADTIGFGWYEVGDKILITDDEAVEREVRVMGVKLLVDGSIKETIWSAEPNKTQTNYARAGGLDKRIKNTEIIVDKQQQEIVSVVSDLATLDGVVNENFTQITQDIDGITQAVQVAGGINLLRNSAFYQTDENDLPTMWNITGTGTINVQTSSEAVSKGSVSGNVVTLIGTVAQQNVSVVADSSEIPEENKTYYSFKVLVKKGTLGEATVRVFNDNEEYIETIVEGVSSDYDEVTFEALLPTQGWYTVELTGDADSDATFTDAMFSVGKYPSAWQQANGEILNTNVNINENGIIVKSSVFAGDYTAITPLEFSGYSKVGGTVIKAFTLNKDQTEVSKLFAENEISMPPIKIVPITTGSMTGWAFVKRGE